MKKTPESSARVLDHNQSDMEKFAVSLEEVPKIYKTFASVALKSPPPPASSPIRPSVKPHDPENETNGPK